MIISKISNRFLVLVLFSTVVQAIFACKNNFIFSVEIPQGWCEECIHGEEKNFKLPGFTNRYMNQDESLRYQIVYANIMKGDVDAKQYIQYLLTKDFDTTLSESLCYYKEEDFHGYPALSYTFGGQTKGINNVGKIYVVKANGYTIVFVNSYIPNKSGKRQEIDVWNTLKWHPGDNWHL